MTDPSPSGIFSTKEGRASGLTPGALRSAKLDKPAHGIRSAVPVVTLGDRCRAYLHRLGERAFVCGPTAALLWNAPVPQRFEEAALLDVAVPAPGRAPKCAGIRGRTLTIDAVDLVTGPGARITSPARTWCDLGGVLELADLVAVGDHFLHTGLADPASLADAVARHPGRRGRPRLIAALALLDGRAESRPESLLRVALVLAGITGVEANAEIRSADGAFLARVDLCIRSARVILEYHGDYHRVERDRWRKDRARMGRLRAAGWFVIELTGDDLPDLAAVVAQVRAAIAR